MARKIATGAAAGLIGGAIFALMAQLITTSTSSGDRTSMLITAAATVHSHGWLAGWVATLIYTLVIGGLFGWLLRTQTQMMMNEPTLMVWGGLYGVVWWIVSGLVVVPALLWIVPLSSDAVAMMRPVVLASLAEHVVFGVILGFMFARITKYVDRRSGGVHGATQSARRAA